ncbi:MAG: hypothetical protein QOJ59_5034 [Thermomicrobiales bacterium]|jgi:hypothetical protein|nr:hypothetical protein [Thermomicrobiales bacterium]
MEGVHGELPGPVTRNRFSRRSFAAMAAGFVLAGTGVGAVSAGRSWCRVDPVVKIDGQLADIFVASDVKMLLSATGPVKIRISMPKGSRGSVILADLGFGKGYDISFVETSKLVRKNGRTPLIIDVYAPARDSSLPVTVTFAPRTLGSSLSDILFGMSASGYANKWVSLRP